MDSKTLSRRAALAGALSLTPAAAVAAMPIGADPDAELIAIGEQLAPLYERELELRAFLIPHRDNWHDLILAASHDIDRMQRDGDTRTREELSKLRYREVDLLWQEYKRQRPEFVAADEEQERLFHPMDDLHRRMFALPARSLRGLAVKARAAAYEYSSLWAVPFKDLDWDSMFLRHAIEELLALAGEELPFEAA